MPTKSLEPGVNGEGGLGTAAKWWGGVYADSYFGLPGFWRGGAIHAVGDVVHVNAPTCRRLVCVAAGTSGSTAPAVANAAEGALVVDGTVTWTVDSLADGFYNAAHQNAVYRGADLTAYWNSGYMSTNIQAGRFVGMHIGDFVTKSTTINGTAYTVDWVLADFDYYLHTGDAECVDHHVLMIAKACIFTAKMNSSNVTTGGYVGSAMWTTTIPLVVTGVKAAFGDAHVLAHRELLSNAVNTSTASGAGAGYTGAASGWAWTNASVNIPNEVQVYGCRVFSSSFFDVGCGQTQLAVMRAAKFLQFDRANNTWLRSVSSSSTFASAYYFGDAYDCYASSALGVRPLFLLR